MTPLHGSRSSIPFVMLNNWPSKSTVFKSKVFTSDWTLVVLYLFWKLRMAVYVSRGKSLL